MSARLAHRWLLSLSPCLALLQGCAAALASKSADVSMAVANAPDRDADPRARSGWQFNFGLGAGEVDVTCDGCIFNSRTGYAAFLSAGRPVGEKTLLGVEAVGWTDDAPGGARFWEYSLMAQATRYLRRSGGFFLRGGVGWIGFRQSSEFQTISANGLGFSSRLGYELGRGSVKVAPYLGYARSLWGASAIRDGSDSGSDLIISNIQLGVSIATP